MRNYKNFIIALFSTVAISINAQIYEAPNGNVGISTNQANYKLDVRKPISLSDLTANPKNDVLQLRLSVSDGFVPDNAESRLLFSVQQWDEGANFNYGAIGSAKANGENYGRMAFYTNVGSSNGTPLGLAERMRIDFNGLVGIGTTKPSSLLDVRCAVSLNEITNNKIYDISKIRLSVTDGFVPNNAEARMLFSIQQWDEGATFNYGAIGAAKENDENYGRLVFYTSKGTSGTGVWHLEEQMRISNNGNVGIGSKNPDSKLTVNGTIHASEVKVDLNVPADYVFKQDYRLMPLNEVEQFVKTNSHLPDVPSATEIKQNGLNMGEMQNKLLQKIEELTLYVIEQQKQIEELKRKIENK